MEKKFCIGLIGGTEDTDNSLNRNTGYTRLTLGYQHSNLFNRDHTLTLAYTTSPDHLSDVKQYGVFYTIPLYGYNTMVTAYWTRSDINSGSVGLGTQSFDVSGSGEFYGLKAAYSLPKFGSVAHNISAAIDSRYFESTVAFLGTPLPTSNVGSQPVSLRYTLHSERGQNSLGGYGEYAFNTDGGRANDGMSYAAARATATQNWDAFRFGVDGSYALTPTWKLVGKVRAQYSNDALIPGEQLGIAGFAGVRGFREREVTGDKGYFLNLEAHGPALMPRLAPYVFYDQGGRHQASPVIGVSTREFISSAGAGFRWQWQRFDLNATWAVVINGISGSIGTPSGHNKLFFSAFYRF